MDNVAVKLNIWETNLKDKFMFLQNYEELFKFMEENDVFSFSLCDTYVPGNPENTIYDMTANRDNIHLTYTDEQHPVAILNNPWGIKILINSEFFNKYKEKFKNFIKTHIMKKFDNKLSSIYIPDFIVDDELVNNIVSNDKLKEKTINIKDCTGVYLTEEQLKKLSESRLDISLKGDKISSKYAINYHTWSELETIETLLLKDDLSDKDLANFPYINDKCVISINSLNENDERKYVENLVRIFNVLQSHNKNYNIKIRIKNRELLMQNGLLNFSNINLTIFNDLYDYKKEELLNEEELLNKLVKPIKEANLSPYEKYLAVYNIVKQFKPYKENNENKEESRYLRYILNNDYMVCVGYSRLLETLLDKVGIPSYAISVMVDTSYDEGFTLEDKPTDLAGHRRNVVKIDDDKYGIHGIFIADATWDNDMNLDLYNNSAMTFDRKKEARRLEGFTSVDFLLDFHNFDEFSQKINFYLKRMIEKSSKDNYNDKIVYEFENMYNEIMEILSRLDYQKYCEFYNKYNELIKKSIYDYKYGGGRDKLPLKDVEAIFNQFLTEYGHYIIPLSNKAISNETLLSALTEVKRQLGDYKEAELSEMVSKVREINEKVDRNSFPYVYDPNNPIPNYLESRNAEEDNRRHSR